MRWMGSGNGSSPDNLAGIGLEELCLGRELAQPALFDSAGPDFATPIRPTGLGSFLGGSSRGYVYDADYECDRGVASPNFGCVPGVSLKQIFTRCRRRGPSITGPKLDQAESGPDKGAQRSDLGDFSFSRRRI